MKQELAGIVGADRALALIRAQIRALDEYRRGLCTELDFVQANTDAWVTLYLEMRAAELAESSADPSESNGKTELA